MAVISENRTVTITEAKNAILRCFSKKRPVFLWGPPGIGKSELVSSVTSGMNGLMIDLRLAQMDPTDIRGIPFYNKELGVMDWAPPIDLPTAELAAQYPIVVLFLDEMNAAPPSVQAAAYQLTLNRRIGRYVLPDNVVIVAAGNRDGDRGVTYRMPSPLSNRFVHLELRVDFDSWLAWAVDHRIHKDVIGFISFSKKDLYNFDPKSISRSFATPRSWTFVSELIDDADADSTITDLTAGTIGEGLALSFMAHRKIASKLPTPTDILDGKVHGMETKEISAMHSLTISMCYELQLAYEKIGTSNNDKWFSMADNFLKFMMDNFPTEVTVMGARVALSTFNLPFTPSKLKNFDEFYKKYGKYVVAAIA